MANSTPAGIVIMYDNSGGTPVDITAHVLSINDIDIESVLEEVRPLGVSWDKFLPIGVAKVAAIELSGLRAQVVAQPAASAMVSSEALPPSLGGR